jgi:hypothetical protein
MKRVEIPDFITEDCGVSGWVEIPSTPTGRVWATWREVSGARSDLESLWKGAYRVIDKFGAWGLEGVAKADITEEGDNTPLSLMMLLGRMMNHELNQHLPLKKTLDWLSSGETTKA